MSWQKTLCLFLFLIPHGAWGQESFVITPGSINVPNEAYNSLYRDILIYSLRSADDAQGFLDDFNSGSIDYDIPSEFVIDKIRLKESDFYSFKIRARADRGAILVLCKDVKYTSTLVKISRLKTDYRITIKSKTDKLQENKLDTAKVYDALDGRELYIDGGKGPRTIVKGRTMDLNGLLRLKVDEIPLAVATRSNSRIIVQPYWLDGQDFGENKVFAYAKPVVLDFKEYDFTQIRRMNFDKSRYDSLSGYFIEPASHIKEKEDINNAIVPYEKDSNTFPSLGYDSLGDNTVKIVEESNIQLERPTITVYGDSVYISLDDTLSGYNPDETYPYPARAIICAEDYNERYFIDTIHIDEGERTNYMKFLDFKYEKDFDLDIGNFAEFQEVTELPSPPIEVQLNFEVNKATIDYSDYTNLAKLDSLRLKFSQLGTGKDERLNQMDITGYASPDGPIERNQELARKRAEFAFNEVRNAINKRYRELVYFGTPVVRGWGDVEELMRKDSLYAEADVIKTIRMQFPGDTVKQFNEIRGTHPELYQLIRERKYLDKLRSVKFDYKLFQQRSRTYDELYQDFIKGNDKEFNRPDYYVMLKNILERDSIDKELLEKVSQRALYNTRKTRGEDIEENDSLYNDGYWALAANIYASCLIDREVSDLSILAPFINADKFYDDSIKGFVYQSFYARRPESIVSGQDPPYYVYTNDKNMIANQIIMLISKGSHKYRNILGDLVDMITPNSGVMAAEQKYQNLIALANCSRGRWMAGGDCTEAEAAQIRSVVSSISETNEVIINIAMADYFDKSENLQYAIQAMDRLPKNSSVSSYLKAILELMRPIANKKSAERYLADAFELDLTKMPIANNDQQLIAPDKTKIVDNAFDLWEQKMSKQTVKEEFIPGLTDDNFRLFETWKAQGTWDVMKEDYVTMVIDETHPYTWYKRAVNYVAGKQKLEEIHTDSVSLCLNKCISFNPDYLSVVRVAGYVDNEVKNSKHGRVLFDDFYTSYISEMRKKKK